MVTAREGLREEYSFSVVPVVLSEVTVNLAPSRGGAPARPNLRTITNEGLIATGIDAIQSWRRSTWFRRRRVTSSSVCLPNLRALYCVACRQVQTSRAIFRARHGASHVFTSWRSAGTRIALAGRIRGVIVYQRSSSRATGRKGSLILGVQGATR